MKNINIKIRKTICLTAIMTFMGLISCQEELRPEIEGISMVTGIRATRKIISATVIYPGSLIFIEGTNLSDISTVTFRCIESEQAAEVPGVFNPAYNSDRMLSITVPWNEPAGSAFGMTEIKITNKDGHSSVFKIEMKKPNATITKLVPEDYQAKPGQTVEIIGRWFHSGVTSVLLGKLNLDFMQLSSEKLTFTMPEVTVGDSVYVYVAGDSVRAVSPKELNPYLGKLTLINDFDGGGISANRTFNTWPEINNTTLFVTIKENGPDGKYAELKNLSSDGFYVRYGDGPPAGWITLKDPSKVSLMFDVCCGPEENIGTSFNIDLFKDWGAVTHTYTYKFVDAGWKRVRIKLSDFTLTGTVSDPDFNMINWLIPGSTTVQLDNVTLVEEGL